MDFKRGLGFVLITFILGLMIGVVRGNAQTVNVWVTTDNQKTKLQKQTPTAFTSGASSGNRTIFVDETQTYQQVEGFGASITDSAAFLLNEKVPAAQLGGVMTSLFDHTNGIGVSFIRNPMGASDITRSVYSYDDLPAGQSDPTLSSFSISHDLVDIVPLVKSAKQINPQLKIMVNPWSPPGWMKTTGSMIGGSPATATYPQFADYFVKTVQAYAAQGIPIDYISLQNEPLFIPGDYPGAGIDAATATTLVRDFVLPAFAANNITAQVLVYDHNWDRPDYPDTMLSDATLANSPQVAGIAWHGYGGTPGAMTTLHNKYPNKGNYETEHSGGSWITDQVKADFEEITQVMRNWSKSYIKWSLALDQSQGPHTGGCGNCNPLVTVNSKTGAVTYAIEYYTLGHFSKFVQPGATRVYSSNAAGFVSAAFKNPDGSKALVVYNDTNATQSVQVVWGDQSFTYSLQGLSGATFTWGGDQNGAPAIQAANQQIQASSYNDSFGVQTESTTDTDAGYDVGFIDGGDWTVYKNLAFDAGINKVNVRTASAGSGGTLEFHLNSADGPLIGTATLPVTGGWQTWTTVSAPVTVATGNADLYLVFKGGASIANLNWFQFAALSQPVISSVTPSGKNLIVTGTGFASGAKILLNGQVGKTIVDAQNPATTLTGKKFLKQIQPGATAQIQVMNPDGGKSNIVQFTR